MSKCDSILTQQGGIFDTMVSDTSKSLAENLYDWLETATYQQYQDAVNAGINIPLPVNGVPLQFGATYSQNDFNNWQQQAKQGNERHFTDVEAHTIVTKTVDPQIVEAWLKCIAWDKFGVDWYSLVDRENPANIVFTSGWKRNSPQDDAPKITSFVVLDGTVQEPNPFKPGAILPDGGMSVVITREREPAGDELYPGVTITLNTEKGTATEAVPPVLRPVPQSPPLSVAIFTNTSPLDSHPKGTITVDNGYKVIGGGARVNWQGAGNMLTASYPSSETEWTALAKDHDAPSPATIDVYALGLYDPNDEWEVKTFTENSDPKEHNRVRKTVPSDYALTCGGAFAHWSGRGSY